MPPVTLVLAVQGELVEEGNLVGEMEAKVEMVSDGWSIGLIP